ncbi:MAG: hypothetical protein P9M14_02085 [Candidatus Alcyoniella australis]|nr:hypothetical protein [Candidatus Alcyoniella australis]
MRDLEYDPEERAMQNIVTLRRKELAEVRKQARSFFRRHPLLLLIMLALSYVAAVVCFSTSGMPLAKALLAALVFVAIWTALFLIIPNLLLLLLIAVAVGATIAIAVALTPSLTLVWSVVAAVGIMAVIVLVCISLARTAKLIPGLVLGILVFFYLKDAAAIWQAAAAGFGTFVIVSLLSIYLLKIIFPAVMTFFLAIFSAGLADKIVLYVLGDYALQNMVPQIPRLSGSLGHKLNVVGGMLADYGRELMPEGPLLYWATAVGLFLALMSIVSRARNK